MTLSAQKRLETKSIGYNRVGINWSTKQAHYFIESKILYGFISELVLLKI